MPVPDSPATTLQRGISVLFALGAEEALHNGGPGVVRIAQLVDQEKSQISRTSEALAQCGVVERDPTTLLYRLSWQFFALAARAGDKRLLADAPDLLSLLVDRLDESAHLTVLRGTQVLTVRTESSAKVVHAAGCIGRTVPAHCASAGRVLLFDQDTEQLRDLFRDSDFADARASAPRSVEELAERIAADRPRGYSFVDEELEAGLVALAAPVRDFCGSIVAALNVSGPKYRLVDVVEEAKQEILATTQELSRRLGAVVTPLYEAFGGRASCT